MVDERKPETVQFADKWAGESCTLNSRNAKIVGRLNRFATVAALDMTLSAQWAWETVDCIMKKGGHFTTT